MRLGKGVEWAVHTLLNLGLLDGRRAGAAQLARAHGLAEPYLTKQLQLLVRAGLLTSAPGPGGGYGLARPLDRISLLDVVRAIDGTEPVFRCAEIRCCGRIGELSPAPTAPCAVQAAMSRAEQTWQNALARETLAGIRGELDHEPRIAQAVRAAFD